jgi:hypothetical protein
MSIGEFARRSQLSPKALRLYDELGPPAAGACDAFLGALKDSGRRARAGEADTPRPLPAGNIWTGME